MKLRNKELNLQDFTHDYTHIYKAFKSSLTNIWSRLSVVSPVSLSIQDPTTPTKKSIPTIIWYFFRKDNDILGIRLRFPLSKITVQIQLTPIEDGRYKLESNTTERTLNVVKNVGSMFTSADSRTVIIDADTLHVELLKLCKSSYALTPMSVVFKASYVPLIDMDDCPRSHKSLYADLIIDVSKVEELDVVTKTLFPLGYRLNKDTGIFYPKDESSTLYKVRTYDGLNRLVEYGDDPNKLIGRMYVENIEGDYNILTIRTIRNILFMENDVYADLTAKSTEVYRSNLLTT